MDERAGHYLGVLAAFVVPVLCGIVVARLMVVRYEAAPGVPTEVVFVRVPSPPVAAVREHAVAAAQPSAVPGEAVSAAAAEVRSGGGGSGSPRAGRALDLSLPDAGVEFGSTISRAGDDWTPSLPRMRVRMVDSSIGARLARMQKGAMCNELKLMASGMSGVPAPDRESLMQELARLRC